MTDTIEVELRREADEIGRWRLQRMLLVMVAVHAAHVAVFHFRETEAVAWRDGIEATHLVTGLVAAGLAAVAWSPLAAPWLLAACALVYLVHGAVIVGFDQLVVASVTPYVGYALAIPLVVPIAPRAYAPVAAVGVVTFVGGVLAMQADPLAQQAGLPAGLSVTVASLALSHFVTANRRRDLQQRTIIDVQRRELEALNGALEQRVRAQVDEIVQRSREVEALNLRLRAQVTDRSNELTRLLAALSSPDRAPGPGSLLAGRYEILAQLGAGGMGQVFDAIDRATGERVAVKQILPRSARELDAVRRLVREARTAVAVDHPAVVKVHAVEPSEDGGMLLVLERVFGETLKDTIHRLGPLPPGVVAAIGERLCGGLAAAHVRGIVHRDVKPSNLMLTSSPPGLKLLDFGIALESGPVTGDALAGSPDPVTEVGVVMGTPLFVDPAVVAGGPVTPAADVWAVGVTLYVAATGVMPRDEDADARDRVPGFPDALALAISACVRPTTTDRPTARELEARFGSVADPLPLEDHVRRFTA